MNQPIERESMEVDILFVGAGPTGYGTPATVTVYGRVTQAAAAAANAGNYSDTVNVTITF